MGGIRLVSSRAFFGYAKRAHGLKAGGFVRVGIAGAVSWRSVEERCGKALIQSGKNVECRMLISMTKPESPYLEGEVSDSIKEVLEAIQVWGYGRVGRNPAEIPGIIDLTRYRQRQAYRNDVPAHKVHEWARATPEVEDPVYKGQMDLIYAKFRTTAYQDPVILCGIAHHIDEIHAAAQVLYPHAASNLHRPLLATVPISMLNGFSLRDAAGEHGVVLQDGLRCAPLQVASEIGRHLFVPHPKGVCVDIDPQNLISRLGLDTQWADSFLGYSLKDVSEPHMFVPSDQRRDEIRAGDARHAYEAIGAGFRTFVLAHEYAHCLLGHLNQIQPTFDGPRMMRVEKFIEETITLAHLKYPQYDQASDEQLTAFALTHALEFEADEVGLKLLINVLRNSGADRGTRNMWLMGALAFFWYVEILERVHRTFEMGDSWFGNDLYENDFHVQGLLLRPTHPAPLERADVLVQTMLFEEVEEWVKQDVLASWRWLTALHEKAWKIAGPVVAAAIVSQKLTVDPKWADEIPIELVAIGVRTSPRSSSCNG